MNKLKNWWKYVRTIFDFTFLISLERIEFRFIILHKGIVIDIQNNLLEFLHYWQYDSYRIKEEEYKYSKIKKYFLYSLYYVITLETGFSIYYDIHKDYPGLSFDLSLLGLRFKSEFRDTRKFDFFNKQCLID